MEDRVKLVLYRLKEGWRLPSLSIACLQVEAYLRLTKVHFAIQDCAWGSFAPTGQIPALDTQDGQIIGLNNPESVQSEFEGAKAIISYLQSQPDTNLDAKLSPSGRADVAAFTTLIESSIIPALLYSTWCENEAYSKLTRIAMGTDLPYPLRHFLPFAARQGVRASISNVKSEIIYNAASQALDALAAKLTVGATDQKFFFGNQPSSLDALLFACLIYLKSAPVIHPDLKKKLETHRVLIRYVERLGGDIFEPLVPTAAHVELKWSPWGTGGSAKGKASSTASTTRPLFELDYKGKLWLLGAGTAIVAYILLSGQYFDISYGYGDDLGEGYDEEDD